MPRPGDLPCRSPPPRSVAGTEGPVSGRWRGVSGDSSAPAVRNRRRRPATHQRERRRPCACSDHHSRRRQMVSLGWRRSVADPGFQTGYRCHAGMAAAGNHRLRRRQRQHADPRRTGCRQSLSRLGHPVPRSLCRWRAIRHRKYRAAHPDRTQRPAALAGTRPDRRG